MNATGLAALEEQVRKFARNPSSNSECLRFLASASELHLALVDPFEEGTTESEPWRSRLAFGVNLVALHDLTRTWRRAQVLSCNGDYVEVGFREFGKEDARWFKRTSPLLQRSLPLYMENGAWCEDLTPGAFCDVRIDDVWVPAQFLDIEEDTGGIQRAKVKLPSQIEDDILRLPLFSPNLSEYETWTAPKARFSFRPTVFVSATILRKAIVPFMDAVATVFSEESGLRNCMEVLRNEDETVGELAFLLCDAFANGLLAVSPKDKALCVDLISLLLSRIPPQKKRISVVSLELFMRRTGTFTEQEIADMIERVTLSIIVDVIVSANRKEEVSREVMAAYSVLAAATRAIFFDAEEELAMEEEGDVEVVPAQMAFTYELTKETFLGNIQRVLPLSLAVKRTGLLMIPAITLMLPMMDSAFQRDLSWLCYKHYDDASMFQVLSSSEAVIELIERCSSEESFPVLTTLLKRLHFVMPNQLWWGIDKVVSVVLKSMKAVSRSTQSRYNALFEVLYQVQTLKNKQAVEELPILSLQLFRFAFHTLNDASLALHLVPFVETVDDDFADAVMEKLVICLEQSQMETSSALLRLLLAANRTRTLSLAQLESLWTIRLNHEHLHMLDGFFQNLVKQYLDSKDESLPTPETTKRASLRMKVLKSLFDTKITALPLEDSSIPLIFGNFMLQSCDPSSTRTADPTRCFKAAADHLLLRSAAIAIPRDDLMQMAAFIMSHELYREVVNWLQQLPDPSELGDVHRERVLDLLDCLLNEADARGTRGNRAHKSVCESAWGNQMKIRISFSEKNVPTGCESLFKVMFKKHHRELLTREGATVWDLKVLIANEITAISVPPSSLAISIKGNVFGDGKENGWTLSRVFNDVSSSTCYYCRVYRLLPPPESTQRLLVLRFPPQLTKKAEMALEEIFNEFADPNSKLITADGMCELSLKCANRIRHPSMFIQLFKQRQCQHEHGMTQAEFLGFYAEAAVRNEDNVWKDLVGMGYDYRTLTRRARTRTSSAADGRQDRLTFDVEEGLRMQVEGEQSVLAGRSLRGELVQCQPLYDLLFTVANGKDQVATLAWELLMRLPSSVSIVAMLKDPTGSITQENSLIDFAVGNSKRLVYLVQLAEFLLCGVERLSMTPSLSSSAGKHQGLKRNRIIKLLVKILERSAKWISLEALSSSVKFLSKLIPKATDIEFDVSSAAVLARASWEAGFASVDNHGELFELFEQFVGRSKGVLDMEALLVNFVKSDSKHDAVILSACNALTRVIRTSDGAWIERCAKEVLRTGSEISLCTVALYGILGDEMDSSFPTKKMFEIALDELEKHPLVSLSCIGICHAHVPAEMKRQSERALEGLWLTTTDIEDQLAFECFECLKRVSGNHLAQRLDDCLRYSVLREEDLEVVAPRTDVKKLSNLPLLLGPNSSQVSLLLQYFFLWMMKNREDPTADIRRLRRSLLQNVMSTPDVTPYTVFEFLRYSSRSVLRLGQTPPLRSKAEFSESELDELKKYFTRYKMVTETNCDACGRCESTTASKTGPIKLELRLRTLGDILTRFQQDQKILDPCQSCGRMGTVRQSSRFLSAKSSSVVIEFTAYENQVRTKIPIADVASEGGLKEQDGPDNHNNNDNPADKSSESLVLTAPDPSRVTLFNEDWIVSTCTYKRRTFSGTVFTTCHRDGRDKTNKPWVRFEIAGHMATSVDRITDEHLLRIINQGEHSAEILSITLTRCQEGSNNTAQTDLVRESVFANEELDEDDVNPFTRRLFGVSVVNDDQRDLTQFLRLRSAKVGLHLADTLRSLDASSLQEMEARGTVCACFHWMLNLCLLWKDGDMNQDQVEAFGKLFEVWNSRRDDLSCLVESLVEEMLTMQTTEGMMWSCILHSLAQCASSTMTMGDPFARLVHSLKSVQLFERLVHERLFSVCERLVLMDHLDDAAVGYVTFMNQETQGSWVQTLLSSPGFSANNSSNPSAPSKSTSQIPMTVRELTEVLGLFRALLACKEFSTISSGLEPSLVNLLIGRPAQDVHQLLPDADLLAQLDTIRTEICKRWLPRQTLVSELIKGVALLEFDNREYGVGLIVASFESEEFIIELFLRTCADYHAPLPTTTTEDEQKRRGMILCVFSTVVVRFLQASMSAKQQILEAITGEGRSAEQAARLVQNLILVLLDALQYGAVKALLGLCSLDSRLLNDAITGVIRGFIESDEEPERKLQVLDSLPRYHQQHQHSSPSTKQQQPFEVQLFYELYELRNLQQMKTLAGIAFLCSRIKANRRLIEPFAKLPVPQDEDRATDWVLRFLLRFPAEQPKRRNAHPLAMDCLEDWARFEKLMDQVSPKSHLRFPHEPAEILVRMAMGTVIQVSSNDDVQVLVIDCKDSIMFWATNNRTTTTMDMFLWFEPTEQEKFALPDTEDMVVRRRLLPGESGVLYEGQRNVEDDEEEEEEEEDEGDGESHKTFGDDEDEEEEEDVKPKEKSWGIFSFQWQFFIIQDEERKPGLGTSVLVEVADEAPHPQQQLNQDTFNCEEELQLDDAEATRVQSPTFDEIQGQNAFDEIQGQNAFDEVENQLFEDDDKDDEINTFENHRYDAFSKPDSTKLPSVSFIEPAEENDFSDAFAQDAFDDIAGQADFHESSDDDLDQPQNATLQRIGLSPVPAAESEDDDDEADEDAENTMVASAIEMVEEEGEDKELAKGEFSGGLTFTRIGSRDSPIERQLDSGDEDDFYDDEDDENGENTILGKFGGLSLADKIPFPHDALNRDSNASPNDGKDDGDDVPALDAFDGIPPTSNAGDIGRPFAADENLFPVLNAKGKLSTTTTKSAAAALVTAEEEDSAAEWMENDQDPFAM